jgi:oligopeptide/dipeptide ABC transporter ATP-binding protein
VTDVKSQEDTPPVLEVRELSVDFRTADGATHAVDSVSWDVRRGETLAIVGESGSGKSVSSLAVMGLLESPPAVISGNARFDGTELLELPAAEHRTFCGDKIGMIFQDALAALNPVYTVGHQLGEALVKRRGMSRGDARKRAVELLDMVRVPNAKDRVGQYPHQFSGGMRQRVMIAMSLALDPQVLIADEPTTALDVTVQARVLDLLAEIQADREMALVMITHDLGVVASLADQVVVMCAGRVVETGGVESIYSRPRHPYTQGLLASIPRLVDPPGVKPEDDLPVFSWRPGPMVPGEVPPLVEVAPGHRVAPVPAGAHGGGDGAAEGGTDE